MRLNVRVIVLSTVTTPRDKLPLPLRLCNGHDEYRGFSAESVSAFAKMFSTTPSCKHIFPQHTST